jgi:hypothetical protein
MWQMLGDICQREAALQTVRMVIFRRIGGPNLRERASKPLVVAYDRSIQIENVYSLNSYPASIKKFAVFAPEPYLALLMPLQRPAVT